MSIQWGKMVQMRFVSAAVTLIAVAAVVTWWAEAPRLSPAGLRLPTPAPPRPPHALSIKYTPLAGVSLDGTAGDICSPPSGPVEFSFVATPAEFRSFRRYPVVAFEIADDGHIDKASVRTSSGSTELDRRATELVGRSKYRRDSRCMRWQVETVVYIDL